MIGIAADLRRRAADTERLRALEVVRRTLAEPPRWPHVVRVEPVGVLVAQFILPLELCQGGNERAQRVYARQPWLRDQIHRKLFTLMRLQHGRIERAPLPGRPLVRAIRFTSRETDRFSDFGKEAIDKLCPSRYRRTGKGIKKIPGLNIIADDRPSLADVHQWCEWTRPGGGFVYLDVHAADHARKE